MFVCLTTLLAEGITKSPPPISCNQLIQFIHSNKVKYFVIGVSCAGTYYSVYLFINILTRNVGVTLIGIICETASKIS